ncbi:MAG: hypothetical protein HY055_08620 [Magnetospirillum sp.]|nr:hypothetical protein [Magnetospirillum sp.]
MNDYYLCGWQIRTELTLPELWPWAAEPAAAPIRIRLGSAGDSTATPVHATPFLEVESESRCRLDVPAVARFLVQDGHDVVVEPRIDPHCAELRGFLLGPVLGLLCHQRGAFPLHGACVRIGETALALAGPSRAGKSTLAAALLHRGHGLLADDICLIDPLAAGGPVVIPTFPRLKLWQETLDALQVRSDGLESNRPGQGKYNLSFLRPEDRPAPVRLGGILLLSLEERSPPRVVPVTGFDAVTQLVEQVYRRRQALALNRSSTLFTAAAAIARTVPVARLIRRPNLAELPDVAALVEAEIGP